MPRYSRYRGRRTGRRALTVVAVLLVAAVVGLLIFAMTRSVDEPYIDTPSTSPSDAPTPSTEPTFIVETPSTEPTPTPEPTPEPHTRPAYLRAVRIDPRDEVALAGAVQLARDGLINTVVVEMGNRRGNLIYESEIELAQISGSNPSARGEAAFDPLLLADLTAEGVHLVAEVSSLKDSNLGNYDTSLAVRWTDGMRWLDGEMLGWLDPYNATVHAHIESVMLELFGLGFDEVLFTNFSFPTSGRTSVTYYEGESVDGIPRGQILTDLAAQLADAAESVGGTVSFMAAASQYAYAGNEEAYAYWETLGAALPTLPDGCGVYLTDLPAGVEIPEAVIVSAIVSDYTTPEASTEAHSGTIAAAQAAGFLLTSATYRYPASW